MADLKISALTASTTPLAGTEVLPIVQSGATKQVSVANLTAGRTQTSNGIVQGTAATGYNFTANTPASGMTSQLLNWYEEGTWTPTDQSGAGLSFTVDHATYVRVGKLVTIMARLTYPVTANTNATSISIPFTAANYDVGVATSDSGNAYSCLVTGGLTTNIRQNNLQACTNAQLSGYVVQFNITYRV